MVVCSPPNQCGTSQSTTLRGPAFLLTLFPSSNWMRPPPNPPPLGPNVLTGTLLRVYPIRGTARRLTHRLTSGSNTICNDPDPLLADIVLFRFFSGFPHWHSFLPPIEWDRPQIYPSLGASVLTGTLLRVYPIRGTARRLTHRLTSDSNTICNDPDPLLADIVIFEFFSGFPQGFKTRLLGGRFPHPFFPFPTNQRGTLQ